VRDLCRRDGALQKIGFIQRCLWRLMGDARLLLRWEGERGLIRFQSGAIRGREIDRKQRDTSAVMRPPTIIAGRRRRWAHECTRYTHFGRPRWMGDGKCVIAWLGGALV
jgi:hypothetical protein